MRICKGARCLTAEWLLWQAKETRMILPMVFTSSNSHRIHWCHTKENIRYNAFRHGLKMSLSSFSPILKEERCLTTYRTHSTGLYYLGYLNILCPLAYSTSSGYHYYLWKIRGSSHCTVCRALNILIRQKRDICAVSGTCVLCLVWLFSSLIKQNIN